MGAAIIGYHSINEDKCTLF